MPLTNDIISQFVKITETKKTKKKEVFAYGEITKVDTSGDTPKYYVKLDGSDIETPVSDFTSEINTAQRVIVMIKNHAAIVTGNITSKSTSTNYVDTAISNAQMNIPTISLTDIDTLTFDE